MTSKQQQPPPPPPPAPPPSQSRDTWLCAECHTQHTPVRRGGPDGPATLCNACGLRLAKRNRGTARTRKRSASAARVSSRPPKTAPAPRPMSPASAMAQGRAMAQCGLVVAGRTSRTASPPFVREAQTPSAPTSTTAASAPLDQTVVVKQEESSSRTPRPADEDNRKSRDAHAQEAVRAAEEVARAQATARATEEARRQQAARAQEEARAARAEQEEQLRAQHEREAREAQAAEDAARATAAQESLGRTEGMISQQAMAAAFSGFQGQPMGQFLDPAQSQHIFGQEVFAGLIPTEGNPVQNHGATAMSGDTTERSVMASVESAPGYGQRPNSGGEDFTNNRFVMMEGMTMNAGSGSNGTSFTGFTDMTVDAERAIDAMTAEPDGVPGSVADDRGTMQHPRIGVDDIRNADDEVLRANAPRLVDELEERLEKQTRTLNQLGSVSEMLIDHHNSVRDQMLHSKQEIANLTNDVARVRSVLPR